MRKVLRSEVKPGQVFTFHGDKTHPCVAILPKHISKVPAGHLPHLYAPMGQVSYTTPDHVVYVCDDYAFSFFGHCS